MENNFKIPLIVLFGPTASGKTKTAIKICEEFSGEIINADSMQIYKYMDIGTAKPTKEEQKAVPHHMIDIVSPLENYSLADYKKQAEDAIFNVYQKGKIPVLTGGTGLYIDTVVNNVELSEEKTDEEYRKYLLSISKEKGNEYLHKMLSEVDKQSAENIHFNNVKRVIRALEMYHIGGITKTQHIEQTKNKESKYNTAKFCMSLERDILYDRINKRVDFMIEQGLLEEVKKILSMGVTEENTAMQAIGYKEPLSYLKGEILFDEMISLIKQSSRRYAKRQMTWFKREQNTTLLKPDDKESFKLLKKTIELLKIV